jgi:hypothetical protein
MCVVFGLVGSGYLAPGYLYQMGQIHKPELPLRAKYFKTTFRLLMYANGAVTGKSG